MMVDMYNPDTIDIDSGVVLSARTSRNTYEAAFKERNRKKIVDKEVQLKLVDSDIPDLKSKTDILQKTWDALLPAEKDIHNSKTMISKQVVVKQKDEEKKEDKEVREKLKNHG